MIPSPASGVLQWLLPPVCGALVGGALGWFVLGRLAIAGAALSGVESLTQWALGLRIGDLAPAGGSPAALSLERAAADSLAGMLGSRAFIYAVRDIVSNLVAGIAARKVSEVSSQLGIPALLEERLLPALARERTREAVARTAGALVADQAGAALGDEVLREISGVFESYVPEAADAVVRWLRSDQTRAYLSERGRELLPRILEKLSELQKLFISAGQFDRRLNEKMPEIVDDTVKAAEKMVRDPLQQKRIVSVFFDSAQDWRDSLLVTPAGAARPWNDARQKLADSASTLLDRFMERMEDPRARQSIAGLAGARLLEDRRTVGAFVSDVFGMTDMQIADVLSTKVLSYLVRPGTAAAIARRLCGLLFAFLKENAESTVGAALRFDAERKRALDESVRARAPRIVEDVSKSLRLGKLLALFGTGMGLVIGLLLSLLRLLGWQ